MKQFFIITVLFVLTTSASAQDMPLSQVLIDGEGWKLVADAKALPMEAKDAQGKEYRFFPDKRFIAVSKRAGVWLPLIPNVTAGGLAATKTGTVYYTVPDEKAVYAVKSGEKPRKVAEDIARPTGVALSPDGGTLVVADAAGKHVYAFRVEKDGSLTCRESYYTLRLPFGQKASGAGGVCFDSAGRLYVASTVGVQCFDPTGRLNGVLLNPTRTPPTAVVFGGADGNELFIQCGDRVFFRKTKAKAVGN